MKPRKRKGRSQKNDAVSGNQQIGNRTIVIEVEGGVVTDVSNIPQRYDYEIIDHDLSEEAE